MRKFFHKLHKVCGLLAGVFIFISCLTGAILVFQDEIRELTYPERYYRPAAGTRSVLPIEKLVEKVEATIPKATVGSVEISADTTRNYVMSIEGESRSETFVDPYTGNIMGQTSRKDPDFFTYTMLFHRWLMDDSRTWGKQIMGASTLLFAFILISGIVYWWPKTKRELKARLQVKTNASRKRLFTDLHASLGIYCTALLLVMALTGLTWSYPWYRQGLYAICGIEMPADTGHGHGGGPKAEGKKGRAAKEDKEKAPKTPMAWSPAYENVKAKYGAHNFIRIERSGKATIKPTNTFGNERRRDVFKLDPESGKLLAFEPHDSKPAHERARGFIYSLHTGSWGGLTTKIIYFIICVIGASFPITGLYLYLKKRKPKKRTA